MRLHIYIYIQRTLFTCTQKNLDIHISVYVITDISIPVSDCSDLICTCNVY